MIANTFIKRPVTAIVISLVLIISGIICINNLAIDQYPKITPPSVSVSTDLIPEQTHRRLNKQLPFPLKNR